MAVKSEDPETRSLIAYADSIGQHGGTGWLAYDTDVVFDYYHVLLCDQCLFIMIFGIFKND